MKEWRRRRRRERAGGGTRGGRRDMRWRTRRWSSIIVLPDKKFLYHQLQKKQNKKTVKFKTKSKYENVFD